MARFTPARTATIAAVSLLIAASPLPQPTPTPTKTVQKEERVGAGEDQKTTAEGRPAKPATPAVNLPQTPDANEVRGHPTNEQGQPATPDWITRFTGVLALVAVLQFLAMMIQALYMRRGLSLTKEAADAARDSARVARDSLEISQRAQVSIENINLSKSAQWIDYELRNSGNLPATALAIKVSLDTPGQIAPPQQWMFCVKTDPSGLSLAPGEVSQQRYPSLRDVRNSDDIADSLSNLEGLQDGVRHATESALSSKRKTCLRFTIAISYLDGFGKQRTSWVWFIFDPAVGEFKPFGSRQE